MRLSLCLCVCSESQEQAQHQLTTLDQEIEKQTVQLREWQLKELVKLRQQLHMPEREKQQMHLQEVRMRRHLLTPTDTLRLATENSSAKFIKETVWCLCCFLSLPSPADASWLVYWHVNYFIKPLIDSFLQLFPGVPEVEGDGPRLPSSSAEEAQGDVWEVSLVCLFVSRGDRSVFSDTLRWKSVRSHVAVNKPRF